MIAASRDSAIGVLVSGGLDSCILSAWLLEAGHIVQPFYIRSGVVWEPWELSASRRFLAQLDSPRLRSLVVLDMPLQDVYADHWSVTGADAPDAQSADEAVYLPGRNAMLLVKAAVWCQINGVSALAMAPLGTSPFGDASSEFINRFQAAINCGSTAELRLMLPFANMNKRQVMELGGKLPLHYTFSCIAPIDGQHCGSCNKCAERRRAFRAADLPDPTNYATDHSTQTS